MQVLIIHNKRISCFRHASGEETIKGCCPTKVYFIISMKCVPEKCPSEVLTSKPVVNLSFDRSAS